MKHDYLGHRKRVKSKYESCGFEGWQDYEVLEFILFYALPRKDTKCLAKRLINKFKSIKGLMDADIEDIKSVEGIGQNAINLISAIKDIAEIYLKQKAFGSVSVKSAADVCDYLRISMQSEKDELLKVLYLNASNRIIGADTVGRGTVDRAPVYPRKVIENAVKRKAVNVILVHNHPSGNLNPSEEDRRMTEKLKKALSLIDVNIIDHIIIGLDGYFSFSEKGLI
ncbi:MAG: DNA repair protein RadC [bacterium]|nr:DNA repair protein RadC [bacterium]